MNARATRERGYNFFYPEACNMCGAPVSASRTIGQRLDGSQGKNPSRVRGISVSICRCAGCGLMFSFPQPRPASILDHYGIPPDSYWRPEQMRSTPGYFEREIVAAKRMIRFSLGMTALDIGVGIGHGFQAMKAAGFDVWGIEPSEPFHRRLLDTLSVPSEKLRQSSVEEAEFAPGMFDFITFGAVLEHLYDPCFALNRAFRWLKPSGILHVEVPSADYFLSKVLNAYYRVVGTRWVTNLSPMHPPFHLFEFTQRSFEANGEKNKYVIAERWIDVASIRHLPRFLHPLLRRFMNVTGTGMQLTLFLRKHW